MKIKAKKQGDKALLKSLTKEQYNIPYGLTDDVNYRRLRYVRYADDFLLGFAGTRSEAVIIKEQIGHFLKGIKLEMSVEKTFVTHATSVKARFLGYNIQVRKNDTRLAKRSDGKRARSINGSIDLQVPPDVRRSWIRRYTKYGKSAKIPPLMRYSDYEIISTYGAQLRGLVNYYTMADNVGVALRYVRWVCMESARKTLAGKHQIKSPRVSHIKYGHKGGLTDKGKLEWQHLRAIVPRECKKSLIAKCGETPLVTRKIVYASDNLPPYFCQGKPK